MEMGCMKVLIVYYSMYGHVQRMAEAVAEGASVFKGVEVAMRRVPEMLPAEVLENELAAARFLGKYVAMIASKLAGNRREIIDAMREM